MLFLLPRNDEIRGDLRNACPKYRDKNRKRQGGAVESFYERIMDAHTGNQLNTNEGVQIFIRL